MSAVYKVFRNASGSIRQIAPNKTANNLITKDFSPDLSLATIKAKDYHEQETTPYNRYYFVLEGELELTIDGETSTLQKGDVCFIGTGTTYEMRGTFEAVVINQPAFGV